MGVHCPGQPAGPMCKLKEHSSTNHCRHSTLCLDRESSAWGQSMVRTVLPLPDIKENKTGFQSLRIPPPFLPQDEGRWKDKGTSGEWQPWKTAQNGAVLQSMRRQIGKMPTSLCSDGPVMSSECSLCLLVSTALSVQPILDYRRPCASRGRPGVGKQQDSAATQSKEPP